MDTHENSVAWIKRIEDLIQLLEGSTISELELSEAGTEIVIRRRPGMMMVSVPQQGQTGVALTPGAAGQAGHAAREDTGAAIIAPLTGVYFASPSPTSPPFASVGDVVQTGQIVALIESMKVFNEILAEVSGRVTALVAPNGEVVQKGDVLIRLEAV